MLQHAKVLAVVGRYLAKGATVKGVRRLKGEKKKKKKKAKKRK